MNMQEVIYTLGLPENLDLPGGCAGFFGQASQALLATVLEIPVAQ